MTLLEEVPDKVYFKYLSKNSIDLFMAELNATPDKLWSAPS